IRARTMSSLSATRTFLRAMSGYLQLRTFPGSKLENGAAPTVISNNFCLLDQATAVVVIERVPAVRTEELVFFELRAHEITGAERADDLEELFGHVTREWESPRIPPRSGASTMSIDESCRVECGSNSLPRPARERPLPGRWSTRGFRAEGRSRALS